MKPVSHCHKASVKEESVVSGGDVNIKITCSKCGEECAVSYGGLKKDEVEAFAAIQKNLTNDA